MKSKASKSLFDKYKLLYQQLFDQREEETLQFENNAKNVISLKNQLNQKEVELDILNLVNTKLERDNTNLKKRKPELEAEHFQKSYTRAKQIRKNLVNLRNEIETRKVINKRF